MDIIRIGIAFQACNTSGSRNHSFFNVEFHSRTYQEYTKLDAGQQRILE
ncbi:MAG: hypothetical protein ACTSWN_01835 [Promethearchaeota archaeon]